MIYEFNGRRPKIADSAYIAPSAVIIGDVTIGEHCFIGPCAVLRGDTNSIFIEEGTAIEDGVIVHVGGANVKCHIGRYVTVGHGAIIHCSQLCEHANVGMGAVLSIRSEIGEYAVVAEGAVVKRGQVIPKRVVVGGAPAKVLRELEEKDLDLWRKSNETYLALTKLYRTPGVLTEVERQEKRGDAE